MARYQNTQLVKPISSFVAEPLDFYQDRLDDMQKKQDAYRINIAGLDKDTSALENDVPGVIQRKKELEGQLSSIRDININDPIQSRKAVSQMGELQKEFSQFGYTGAVDRKSKQAEAIKKTIQEGDKNPFKQAYRLKKVDLQTKDPQYAVRMENGIPVNANIQMPEDWDDKDVNATLRDMLKSINPDTRSINGALRDEDKARAILSYTNGNIEELTGQKILNSLTKGVESDLDLQKSITARAEFYGLKPQDIIKSALESVVSGAQYEKSNLDKKYMNDQVAVDRKKSSEDRTGLRPLFSTPETSVTGSGQYSDMSKYFNISNSKNIDYSLLPDEVIKDKTGKLFSEASKNLEENGTMSFDINKMPKETKDIAMKVLKNVDPQMFSMVEKGVKIPDYLIKENYPKIQKVINQLDKDIKTSASVIGFDENSQKRQNNIYFGSDIPTVANISSANFKNTKIIDAQTGKEVDHKTLVEDHDSEQLVNISGQLTPDNPYVYKTGKKEFVNGYEVNIGDKKYIMSGPRAYQYNDGSTATEANNLLKRDLFVNDINNLRYSYFPEDYKIGSNTAKVAFVPTNEDRSEGRFSVNFNGKTIEFNTAEEAEKYIIEDLGQ